MVFDYDRFGVVAGGVLRRNVRRLNRSLADALKPPERLTVSEWAAEHRYFPDDAAIPGQWSHDTAPGRRCVYQVARDTAATDGGTATLPIFPMLRTMLVPGDVVELAVPKVQGEIEGDFSWDVPVGRFASLSFTIAEEE